MQAEGARAAGDDPLLRPKSTKTSSPPERKSRLNYKRVGIYLLAKPDYILFHHVLRSRSTPHYMRAHVFHVNWTSW